MGRFGWGRFGIDLPEEVNRKLPARNMMVQLLILYTHPESHSITDG